ncbi:exodeoxyribonuclease V subunit beta [Acidothermaceae bacterium B102]|nr:exodeoxyribonuclease V subunit beta [Acidothermaceae bacterium B102]
MTESFDLLGPLPTGTTVLEASAGTGKTYTIAALVTRYVAEGIATMDQLLVVSFSRESTRELRERVRERLVSARDGILGAVDPKDEVLVHLAAVDHDELLVRARRLEEALATFDAATVTTTHGFCQQVLMALGTAGDLDPDALLVEDLSDLVREVAEDLYLRQWGRPDADPPSLKPAEFRELATAAAKDRTSTLLPARDTDGTPGLRARVAAGVQHEVDKRKRRQHLIDFDDLQLRLAAVLKDPMTRDAALSRLRDRYTIVLVDEFQDTDPVQWAILRDPFHGHATLVLIGDPKQAIYGFRGADVFAYLDAVSTAGTVSTLPTSYRADAALLDGLAAVFRGAALGDPRIQVVPVTAVHDGRLVTVENHDAPVRLRVLARDGQTLNRGVLAVGTARPAIADDLTAEVVAMLSGGATLHPRNTEPDRPLHPGDIAVLVRTNAEAQLVSAHLQAAGVPVVVTGRTSVFSTKAAEEWQLLLEALEQPHRTTRVRRLALSCFVGRTALDLAVDGDAIADELGQQLRTWIRVLDERGVAALFEAVSLNQRLQERLLGQVGGERLLTDLRHIAQALYEAALQGQLGLTTLSAWLRRRREDAERDSVVERSRRLDSDAAAVQILTVHTSKGLEFPVVMVPYAWNHWPGKEPTTAVFHDHNGDRVRDVGGPSSPDWGAHVLEHKREETDDELRLTYVALTRAQSHLVLWWAPTTNTPTSPLHRLMLHNDPSTVAPTTMRVPNDADARKAFDGIAGASHGGLAIESLVARPAATWSSPAQPQSALAAAVLDRALDTGWRRTSYSALTAAAHDARLGSEPEISQTDDEADLADLPSLDDATPDPLREVTSLWDSLAGGARFGTLVHGVLELLDHPTTNDVVRESVAKQVARQGPAVDVDALTEALLAALATPLGHLTDGAALRDIKSADRLPELDFEMPLAGGDDPTATRVMLADLVPLWRQHCPTGPLAAYADALAHLDPTPLRGYLSGSIDAVFRIEGPRYVIADYKTNWLGRYDEPLTAWSYRPESMADAMIEAHYPLQALLYNVALHRYLRWRQPDYDPDVHLGGVLYLFLRGMSGPGVSCADGSAPGVFSWRPPTGLVTGASDLLAGLA